MLLTKPLYLTRVILVTLTLVVLYPFILFADLTLSSQTLDSIEKNYNHHARERVVKWQALLNQPVDDLSDNDKLELVNTFFNSTVQFINDSALWNQEDYWATPLEFLSIGAGDCEDYAIAKYFTLKELGVDESKLRLTYVKAVEIGQAHMVLTYFETKRSIPLVLDNLIIEIKPANQRRDLVPVYSFNGDGLWLAKSRGEGQRVGNASRLSLWEDLNLRMLNANH
jgi:predicted transglutaminase-like cysteine proteinase